MKRRAFFGFLGGAAVSGPAVAKAAASDMSSLALDAATSYGGDAPVGGLSSSGSDKSWVKDQLKRFLGKSAAQIAYEKRETHVSRLDPNVACLRSVALGHKIEMTRNIHYERRERSHEAYLRGHLKGWFG